MGWSFLKGTSKEDIINYLSENQSDRTVIAHALRGNVLWTVNESTATKERWIVCNLLESSRDYGWGYKDMEEAVHPYYYTCPVTWLDMVEETNPKWRAIVREEAAKVAKTKALVRKIEVGDNIYLKDGLAPNGPFVVKSVKPLIATHQYMSYRLKASTIDRVEKVYA